MAVKLTMGEHDFLCRLRDERPLRAATREEDRTRQACRKKRWAVVKMNPRHWVITPAGRQALQEQTS